MPVKNLNYIERTRASLERALVLMEEDLVRLEEARKNDWVEVTYFLKFAGVFEENLRKLKSFYKFSNPYGVREKEVIRDYELKRKELMGRYRETKPVDAEEIQDFFKDIITPGLRAVRDNSGYVPTVHKMHIPIHKH